MLKWMIYGTLSFIILFSCTVRKTEETEKVKKNKKENIADSSLEEKEKKIDLRSPKVTTMEVTEGWIKDYIMADASIRSERIAQVFSDVTGRISEIKVSMGQYIKKGDILAYIDPNKLGNAQFNMSPIYSPMNGVLVKSEFVLGTMIKKEQMLFEIASYNFQDMKAYMTIFMQDINNVAKDKRVYFSLKPYSNEILEGKIREINPSLDARVSGFKLIADLSPSTIPLYSGMYAMAKIVTQNVYSIRIPFASMLQDLSKKKYFVFIVNKDSQLKKTFIRLGITSDDMVEVIDGLKVGQKMLYTIKNRYTDGMKVNVVQELPVLSVKQEINFF